MFGDLDLANRLLYVVGSEIWEVYVRGVKNITVSMLCDSGVARADMTNILGYQNDFWQYGFMAKRVKLKKFIRRF